MVWEKERERERERGECVCVCVRERERETVCVCVSECVSVWVSVWVCEVVCVRERTVCVCERDCVRVCERETVCVCACVRACVWEREREREIVNKTFAYMVRVHLLQFETRWVISLLCQTTKVHAGLLGQVCDKNTTANKLSPCKAAYNPEMRNSLGHNRINHPHKVRCYFRKIQSHNFRLIRLIQWILENTNSI